MTHPSASTLARLQAANHLLRRENLHLRVALGQAEAQLADAALAAEQAAVEVQIREALGLPPEAPINWQAVAQWCAGTNTPLDLSRLARMAAVAAPAAARSEDHASDTDADPRAGVN